METIQARKRGRPAEYDLEDEDELYVTRMPSSARRYRPAPPVQQSSDEVDTQNGVLIQRRRSSLSPKHTSGIASSAVTSLGTETQRSTRRFPLVAILVGVVLTIVLFMSLSVLGSWWHTYQDDLHYGRPRTFQLDAVVGHADSATNKTHFIFLNLNRHVEIIEIPGGDATRTRIFLGPVLFGDGQDLTPVTGEIRDVNGDGKPDLILHIQTEQIVFLNDGTTFKPQ
ncbi:MAG: hypothetical protein JO215_13495 [Ktedonobacteraceae bacterium]|nr:hypothetical protein [Ktedonobacteraceae bacterium]MBV9710790.1 hypothetical protein [Ktedonobacteraceae bacterium]